MSLESVVWLNDLNAANPPGTDPKNQGDDHIRNIKKALRDSFPGFAGGVVVTGVDGGVANAYTLTPATALPAYIARMIIEFSPTVTNTGASTLNISALGVLPLVSVSGAALMAGELQAGWYYAGIYDGTSVRLLSVTKNYTDSLAFSAALPAQPGGATPYGLVTRNSTASWGGAVSPRRARTANTMLVALDSGQFIDVTSGTFTQTFDTPANLQDGWALRYRNSSTGNITIPSSDGLTNWIMYPGEDRTFYCDGTALTSAINAPFSMSITTVGANNFIKPPGYKRFGGIAWSGGAPGEQGATSSNRQGGPGGGAFPFTINAALIPSPMVITVGDGGLAGSINSGFGTPGGNTSVGTFITVLGAQSTIGGRIQNSTTGIVSTGTYGFESSGQPATNTIYGGAMSQSGAAGAGSVYGGAAGGGTTNVPSALAGGTSLNGGNGGAGSLTTGVSGTAPAGGGGAGPAAGNGARGQVDIWGVA